MARILLGDLCAYIPSSKQGEKAQYLRIGVVFQDTDADKRISIKLDSLPIDKNWAGWCNVFARRSKSAEENAEEFAPKPMKTKSANSIDSDDDIPF